MSTISVSPSYMESTLPCHRQDLISCEELEAALTRLKETSGEAKVRSLVSVLDADHDGNINIREVAEVSTPTSVCVV